MTYPGKTAPGNYLTGAVKNAGDGTSTDLKCTPKANFDQLTTSIRCCLAAT
jgi:hypothetical protein